MKFEINQTYSTLEGDHIICYEKTDTFSFLCPFEIIEDGDKKTLIKNIKKTTVYSNETEHESPIETIETIETYLNI